jgi:hypothetical protein
LLDQSDGIDAGLPKAVLAGTENPVFASVVPERGITITVVMPSGLGASSSICPKTNAVQISGDLIDGWENSFYFLRGHYGWPAVCPSLFPRSLAVRSQRRTERIIVFRQQLYPVR